MIQALREQISRYGIQTKQTEADADILIVSTDFLATDASGLPVIVVGMDIDLMIMLVAHALHSINVYPLCQIIHQ